MPDFTVIPADRPFSKRIKRDALPSAIKLLHRAVAALPDVHYAQLAHVPYSAAKSLKRLSYVRRNRVANSHQQTP